MGYKFTPEAFNELLNSLKKKYKVYAPILLRGKGKFSDTDLVGYDEISTIEDVVFTHKSYFSPKETFHPVTQTHFYFNENEYREPAVDEKGILVFLKIFVCVKLRE